MKLARKVIARWTLSARRALARAGRRRRPIATEPPLRARLLSAEQMERQGRALAHSHRLGTVRAPDRLLERLVDNRRVLEQACDLLGEAVQAQRRLTPAGEWLLDNMYLVEEQIGLAQRHLPKGYSRELPRLASGASAGMPRVYDIALSAISHGDGRIDAESLSRFVAAYQSVAPLRLGELWAIPIMLRLALIENLRRVGARVIVDRTDRNLADEWADRLTGAAESDPRGLVLVIADMVRSHPPMKSSFVAELARRLQGKSAALAIPLNWIELWLGGSGHTIERMVHAENQQQAADQVSISNSIGSIRFLSTMDWREFVERMSVVERCLRDDPTATYARMDFATRDLYRHVVERLARRARLGEQDVAARAVRLAQAQAESQPEGRGAVAAHVGYYLVDDGLSQLERELGLRRPPLVMPGGHAGRFPLAAYLAPIATIVATCTLGLLDGAGVATAMDGWTALIAALCVIAFSELGIGVVNLLATLLAMPRMLPRLDFSDGIPDSARTLVVVPTMFGDAGTIAALAEALEVRFLANRDANLHFALLTDWFDAPHETEPGDAALLDAASHAIDALNLRHAPGRRDRFFLFHRPRVWNARERCWMGYERKRGKLAAINAFLRGGGDGTFQRIVGDTRALAGVRYVITLDTDTRLPRDAARRLAGTLAHPLNRAMFDARTRCVVRGYGILQPRVGVGMSKQRPTWYARLFGSEPGIDPYTRAVSDVYQDLFGEGSFVGKGIYDVDAFERALEGRFPENRILSHDLLEGCHARAGLVSDVQLYEDYPSRYAVDVKRRYRWIRGDWQLLPWLLPTVARQDGRRERNPLTMLSRGKVLDNLRRSLVPAAMTALLVIGWLFSPAPFAWTLWVVAILVLPPLIASLASLLEKPADLPLASHLQQSAGAAARRFATVPPTLACLPYEAWFSLGAIVRTLWRLLVTRRKLLRWNPSSEVERTLGTGALAALRAMWFAPAFAALVGTAVAFVNPAALAVAAPVLVLWACSPLLMWWLGRPRGTPTADLSSAQHAFLRRIARRTWSFFETHVGPADHWLPPDNVQEQPALVVARRTSPTNIGLALLANLTACDFGYLMPGPALARIGNALRTLGSLPRHEGHFYNWYDTETLEPLPPRYVSTVDSGNLAAHLLTLRQGLLAWPAQAVLPDRTFDGLADTLGVLAESPGVGQQLAAIGALRDRAAAVAGSTLTLAEAVRLLSALREDAASLERALEAAPDETRAWAAALRSQCESALAETLPCLARDAEGSLASDSMPTLFELAQRRDAAGEHARARMEMLEQLAALCAHFAQMQFGFLYDRSRRLLAIGYSAEERRLDAGYYDLLASEARLCTFFAIAQGQLPQDAWFALGRLLTQVDGAPALLSWSGSMFEYLMPQLVMPSYEGTLLDQTARAAVERQVDYGRQRNVPWGISESGYNTVDARMNYQYRAFGVPGLGLQRGLAADLVVAPYATLLALMVAPEEACENLQRLAQEGFVGRHGYYEAIDYTPARLPRGQRHAVVRSFMAHHQGMGLLALSHLLHDQPMQKRFVADPGFQATLLLLQERIPRTGVFHPHTSEAEVSSHQPDVADTQLRMFGSADTARPAVQMLSNSRYHVMLTNAGGGYSRLRDVAVTRWREDATRDHWGSFCYLRDVASGEFWSAAFQPTGVALDGYEAILSDAKAEFRGRRRGFDMHLEIAVSPEDDVELRRLRITNRGRAAREIEITTYAEVVLAPAISDELHPSFSNLFVQTELVRAKQAILCTRRPRSLGELPPWMLHLLAVHEADVAAISYETDRSRFIGRGNTLARPHALTGADALSDSEGSVLDPIVAIRCRLVLAPEQTATVDMLTGIAASHEQCAALIEKYRDRHLADRVFDLAWTHSQVVRMQINAGQGDAQLYERMAGLVLYAHAAMRAEPGILLQNRRGQPGLWGHGISGDLPIVLLKIADAANIELVRQLVQAHAYWRLKGLAVDLVIWHEDQAGYRQHLHDRIMGLVAAGVEAQVIDRPGGIFVRPAQQISHEDRILLQSVARIVVSDAHGTLVEQVHRRAPPDPLPDPPLLAALEAGDDSRRDALEPGARTQHALAAAIGSGEEALLLDNGRGGFSRDGREYHIRLDPGGQTPAPWSNVLANACFGTVVSESACGYTWGENAHAFRLTPWHNDPVADATGEAIYLRDDETGRCWSPTPLPRRGAGTYATRHGFGYSVYTHVEDGIATELWVHVARDDAVKFSVLKLENRSGRDRALSATGYVEWVLGDLRARTQMHVVTELDAETGTVTARNPYSVEFGQRVAFFAADAEDGAHAGLRSVTADRREFIGRNGSMEAPAAMRREHLSGRHGAGLDPCAAIQVPLALAAGASQEIVFRLGFAHSADEATALASRCSGVPAAHAALAEVQRYWSGVLGAVQVETPDPAIDVLANGWLLYQTIGCRYLARSGYYQSGGAFGFRDQLQDTMAMIHAQPEAARAHLVLCASHQFPQGDVQHWWHPPLDRGVRTHCSDDFLWLPFAACRYVEATQDLGVLDEAVHYIEGRPVNLDEESYYDLPTRSPLRETVYRHCVRSIERALGLLGERGLPLIATGDWNDGMNRVGVGGRGESVWLGFFLYTTLERFGTLAQRVGDEAFAERCRSGADALRANLDRHAWDGAWYRRAWFDNGTPLGSASSGECMIDSIAQSWSVLSGAGEPTRAAQAMASLDRHLVRRDAGLVQLLQPPFDRTEQDPGYIRGYVPGVRENGGQYTHAAIWATMAFAALGDRDRAWELMRMINPVNHALDAHGVATYKVEPYVVAADVYAVAPHVGRGGWTWYTGSAGWMYRLIVESLLGLNLEGDVLRLAPCVPAEWPGYAVRYRWRATSFRIAVRRSDRSATSTLALDGVTQDGLAIPLRDDGAEHAVDVVLRGDDGAVEARGQRGD